MIDIEGYKARFDETISNHQMTVLQESGIHRHLRFRQPDTGDRWFEIITWPGSLCIGGDMGTYVFSRLNDMFEFFRKGQINPGYWHEKLMADSWFEGSKKFSEERLRKYISADIEEYAEYKNLSKDEKTSLSDEIESDIDFESEYSARASLENFESYDFDFLFVDTYEWKLTEFTGHFIWCLYAIVWAIEQYDKAKEPHHEPPQP